MLGDNIQALRKQKGYSQETLAERLHVVRQTVSKWEKGLSVPDAAMLQAMAELFEVPVSDLLGATVPVSENMPREDEVAKQLAILNDHLVNQATRRKKTIRRCAVGIAVGLFLLIALYLGGLIALRTIQDRDTVLTRAELTCELNGETYRYEVIYDQNYRVREAGGDAWIAFHAQAEEYDDANEMIAQIEDYFADRGGTCTVTTTPGQPNQP